MTEKGLLGTSIAGIAAVVLCCLGPSLGVLLGAVGLGTLLGVAGKMLLAAAVVIVLAARFYHRRATPRGWKNTARGDSLREPDAGNECADH